MTGTVRCPSCGAELSPQLAEASARSAAITDRWEALRDEVSPPRSIAEMLAGTGAPGPTWWLPSLCYLAYQTTDRADARAVLDEFAARRDELGYAVVEEVTDDVLGLSVQPWPLLDARGRLRFPISTDPVQVELRAADLQQVLSVHRRRWFELGLLQEQLVERQVHVGDAYALTIAHRPAGSRLKTLTHPGEARPRYLGGLLARRTAGSVAVPIVDISWDAREAGKLAHYAAAAGVIPPEPGPAVAPVAEETEARYMIGFAEGVDPRDVALPQAST